MLLALLANPGSGRGDALEAEQTLREQGAAVLRFGLDGAEDAARSGAARIAVAGGDGSIGAAAAAAGRARVPLAVIPVGTANDFARALDLPLDLARACRVAVAGTETRRLDLAWIGSRPFVNVASAGLAPAAARRAQGLKRVIGPLAYSAGAVRAAVRSQPIRCRVECDGEAFFDGSAWQLSAAVTGAFGGGAAVEADPRDGELDLVVFEAGSRARLIGHAYRLRAGGLRTRPDVRAARCREIRVDTEGDGGFNVDGELVEARQARLRVDAGAFELVTG